MATSLVENVPPHLSPSEAADVFGVKRETIYRHIRGGTLPAVRVVGSLRIPSDALIATLEGTRTGPTGKAATWRCTHEQRKSERWADRVIAEDDERRRPSVRRSG
jgi:excisionase family DNA binding protein